MDKVQDNSGVNHNNFSYSEKLLSKGSLWAKSSLPNCLNYLLIATGVVGAVASISLLKGSCRQLKGVAYSLVPLSVGCVRAFIFDNKTKRNIALRNFSSPIRVEKPETQTSRGLLIDNGVAIAHESYGSEKSKSGKTDASGLYVRNCDRVGISFNIQTRPCAVVADGSGVRKNAVVAASSAVQGSLQLLEKNEYFSTDKSDNEEACKELLLETLKPENNDFWKQKNFKSKEYAGTDRDWGGSTTVSLVSIIEENKNLYACGAVLGDAIALHISKAGVVSILASQIDCEKNVSSANGQLVTPDLVGAGMIHYKPNKPYIEAFVQIVEHGDKILLASDFLADNVNNSTKEEFQKIISYIIRQPAFDNYDVCLRALAILLPKPDALFSEDEEVKKEALAKLRKPTVEDFTKVFGAVTENKIPTEGTIVVRLDNYSRWINECLTNPVLQRLQSTIENIDKTYPSLSAIQEFPFQKINNNSFDFPEWVANNIKMDALTPTQNEELKKFLKEYSRTEELYELNKTGIFGKSDDATLLVFDPFMTK